MTDRVPSTNFGFLALYDARFAQLGAQAERYFGDDPHGTLTKLRTLAELLAQEAAARLGVSPDVAESQAELLGRLRRSGACPARALDLFHHLRQVGNAAVHQLGGGHGEALTALKVARELAVWFHRSFGHDPGFKPGPFQPPQPPPDPTAPLAAEIGRLREECFNLAGLDSHGVDQSTRVHVTAIQGLVRRVLGSDNPASVPSPGKYDLLVVDARTRRARVELERISNLAQRYRTYRLTASFSGNLGDDVLDTDRESDLSCDTVDPTRPRRSAWIPRNWTWIPLGVLVTEGPQNGNSPPVQVDGSGTLSLRLVATTSGKLDLSSRATKRPSEAISPGSQLWLQPGDLLVRRSNALEHLGASAVYDGPPDAFIYPE